MLTQARVKELFDYNPNTGELVRHHYPTGRQTPALNAHYRKVRIDGTVYKAHRVIWLYMTGHWPEIVDHINGDTYDNTFENLRNVDFSANVKNAKRRKDNKSGVTGVGWWPKRNKWCASIRVDGQLIYLGFFKAKDDAIEARKDAAAFYGFHENHGREEARARINPAPVAK